MFIFNENKLLPRLGGYSCLLQVDVRLNSKLDVCKNLFFFKATIIEIKARTFINYLQYANKYKILLGMK